MTGAFLVILWGVLGGLWRRIFGGWSGLPRSICYAIMVPLTTPLWFRMSWSDAWWPYSIVGGLLVTAACLLFFVVSLYPGATFSNADTIKKYGPFGLGYWFARLWWPDSWRVGGFVDGPAAVGEIFLGASFWAAFMVVIWWS